MAQTRIAPASVRLSPLNPCLVFGPSVSLQLFGGGEAVWQARASWCPTSPLRRWPVCWQLRSSYQGSKAPPVRLISIPPLAIDPSRVVRGQVGAGGMLVRLLSGSRLVAERRFAFQELPPGLRALKHVLRPVPRELWQLFDVVSVLLENGWASDRSETQIFSSRLCGSFIKNRQINKQITAHYERVLQFLFKRPFAGLKALNKDGAS